MTIAVISLITALLPVVVAGIPSISTAIKQVVNDVSSSLGAVLKSGVVQNVTPTTILLALQGVIAALRAEPNIPAEVLNLIDALDRAAQAAVAADKQALQGVNPSNVQPITPLP